MSLEKIKNRALSDNVNNTRSCTYSELLKVKRVWIHTLRAFDLMQ